MSRTVQGILLAAMICCLWPAAVQAQPTRDRTRSTGREGILSELDRARLHLGPFYVLSDLEIMPLYDLVYDFNVLGQQKDHKRDFGAAFGTPLKLFFVPRKKFVVTADVRPMYRWFANDASARDFGYSYRSDAHFLLNHVYLDLWGEVADQRVRDRAELNHLADRQGGSYGALGELNWSRSTINLAASRRNYDYPLSEKQLNPSVTLLSRDENSVSATLRHKTFGSTSTYVGGELTDYTFKSAARDSRRQEVFIGAIRDRAVHNVEVELGWADQTYDGGTQSQNFRGAVGRIRWLATPRNTLQLTTALQRDLEFSTFGSNNHYVNDRFQVLTSIPLGRLFRIDLQGQAARDTYPIAEVKNDGTFAKRRDTLLLASAGASVNVGRHLGIGVGLGYYDRASNFEQFQEDGIQPMLLLSVRP